MIQAPRGTVDVLPQDSYKWQYIESLVRDISARFGYKELRTPIFEFTELFERGVGETTDVVQKEMYTFEDKGGRSITLKPEGTAGAVRAFLENNLGGDVQPTKLYYITPVFRYEKPQKGRLREHHQFGVEAFGSQNPSLDAEIISMAMNIYNSLGVEGLIVHINNIGCPICRKEYHKKLKEFLGKRIDGLCETCKGRFEKNPLRILDCKEEKCKAIIKGAPSCVDNLCEECDLHFKQLKNNLTAMGIKYEIDPNIVRGLDYYTKTVFEIIDIAGGFTVCGGGRYDGLVEEIGGKTTPGIGFGMGLERLLLTLEEKGIEIPKPQGLDLFIATIGEKAELEAQKLLFNLRSNGISCDKDHMARSLKAQMKYADKIAAKYSIVLGDDEINSKNAAIKNMTTGEKLDINLDNIVEQMKGLK